MNTKPTTGHKRGQKGFTLLESLVSMLILAIGLFGMLGVIVNSLRLTYSANHRTIATQQAYSMVERVRANQLLLVPADATAAADINQAFFSQLRAPTNLNCRFTGTTNNLDCTCYSNTGCTGANFLGTVFQQWRNQLVTVLPQGDGTICRDSDPANNLPQFATGGVVNWNCSGTGGFVVKVCWNESRITASQNLSSINFGGLCTFVGV